MHWLDLVRRSPSGSTRDRADNSDFTPVPVHGITVDLQKKKARYTYMQLTDDSKFPIVKTDPQYHKTEWKDVDSVLIRELSGK